MIKLALSVRSALKCRATALATSRELRRIQNNLRSTSLRFIGTQQQQIPNNATVRLRWASESLIQQFDGVPSVGRVVRAGSKMCRNFLRSNAAPVNKRLSLEQCIGAVLFDIRRRMRTRTIDSTERHISFSHIVNVLELAAVVGKEVDGGSSVITPDSAAAAIEALCDIGTDQADNIATNLLLRFSPLPPRHDASQGEKLSVLQRVMSCLLLANRLAVRLRRAEGRGRQGHVLETSIGDSASLRLSGLGTLALDTRFDAVAIHSRIPAAAWTSWAGQDACRSALKTLHHKPGSTAAGVTSGAQPNLLSVPPVQSASTASPDADAVPLAARRRAVGSSLSPGMEAALGLGPLHLIGGSLGVSTRLVRRQRRHEDRAAGARRLSPQQPATDAQRRADSTERQLTVVRSNELRDAVARLALELYWVGAQAAGARVSTPAAEADSLLALGRSSRASKQPSDSRSAATSSMHASVISLEKSVGDGAAAGSVVSWRNLLLGTGSNVTVKPTAWSRTQNEPSLMDASLLAARALRVCGDIMAVEGVINIQIRTSGALSPALASELAHALVQLGESKHSAAIVDWLAQHGYPASPLALLQIATGLGREGFHSRGIQLGLVAIRVLERDRGRMRIHASSLSGGLLRLLQEKMKAAYQAWAMPRRVKANLLDAIMLGSVRRVSQELVSPEPEDGSVATDIPEPDHDVMTDSNPVLETVLQTSGRFAKSASRKRESKGRNTQVNETDPQTPCDSDSLRLVEGAIFETAARSSTDDMRVENNYYSAYIGALTRVCMPVQAVAAFESALALGEPPSPSMVRALAVAGAACGAHTPAIVAVDFLVSPALAGFGSTRLTRLSHRLPQNPWMPTASRAELHEVSLLDALHTARNQSTFTSAWSSTPSFEVEDVSVGLPRSESPWLAYRQPAWTQVAFVEGLQPGYSGSGPEDGQELPRAWHEFARVDATVGTCIDALGAAGATSRVVDIISLMLEKRASGAPPGEDTVVALLGAAGSDTGSDASVRVVFALRQAGALEEQPSWVATPREVRSYLRERITGGRIRSIGRAENQSPRSSYELDETEQEQSKDSVLEFPIDDDESRWELDQVDESATEGQYLDEELTDDGEGGDYGASPSVNRASSGSAGTNRKSGWSADDRAWGFRVRLDTADVRDSFAQQLLLQLPSIRSDVCK